MHMYMHAAGLAKNYCMFMSYLSSTVLEFRVYFQKMEETLEESPLQAPLVIADNIQG